MYSVIIDSAPGDAHQNKPSTGHCRIHGKRERGGERQRQRDRERQRQRETETETDRETERN